MTEQRPGDGNVIARWDIFGVDLVDLGGDERIARFNIEGDPLIFAGCEREFLKKLARHLYKHVHVEIVVRIDE